MGFNANDHKDDSGNFEPFPAGEYTFALVKVERKEANSSPGNYYQECQISVIKGEYKKRLIFLILPFESTDAGKKYARAMLANMMLAIGISKIKDVWNLTPLLNKPFKAKVKITIDENGKYDPKNEIKRFIPKEEEETPSPDIDKKAVKKQIKKLK